MPHVANASRYRQELLPSSLNNTTPPSHSPLLIANNTLPHTPVVHTSKMATLSKMSRANNMQLFHMLPKNGLYYEFWVRFACNTTR